MSVEIGESTQVGAKEWTATYSNGGLVCGTAQANMAKWNDANPSFGSGGLVTGSPSGAVGVILDSPSSYYAPPYSMDDPGTIPDSLCPNCRRDRHDYPLTETVAEMWKSLSFDEGYDPDNDDSRIVCPGSDVCGPAMADRHSLLGSMPGAPWVTYGFDGSFAHKAWLDKIMTWPQPYLPTVQWPVSTASGWSIADLNQLKDEWKYEPDYQPLEITVSSWLSGDDEPAVTDLSPWTPFPQAAIEAAPKQIEHEAPQAVGFDFSNIKTAYPTYPTGKKKKK